MDVIGVGFGRTGTLSLKTALERLGFGPCLHMLSLDGDPGLAGLFRRAAEGDTRCLAAATGGHRSTVDWPGAYFWRELVAAHPAAKVILTVRDPARWYTSAHDTIYEAAQRMPQPPGESMIRTARAIVWDKIFGGRFADRERTIKIFEDHNAAVRREVPAARLLELDVSGGWAPLCTFLGVPAPREPFPHANDKASFRERRFAEPAGDRPR